MTIYRDVIQIHTIHYNNNYTKLWFNETCYKNMIAAISSKHAHAHTLLKNIVSLQVAAALFSRDRCGRSEPTLCKEQGGQRLSVMQWT